jgi:hypothetical protein
MRGQQLRDAFKHPTPMSDSMSALDVWGPRGGAGYFATGGPSGNDTIPAWLSPGEFVMNPQATKAWGPQLAFMNAQHFDTGSTQPLQPQPGQPAPPPPAPHPGSGKPPGPLGAGQKPTEKGLAAALMPGQGSPAGKPGAETGATQPGLAAPGADTELLGQEHPSKGMGIGGGAIGAAEGAAAGMAGPGAMGAQAAMQLINRTAACGAQLGGIAVEAGLETFLPSDSPLSNFGNTLPGRILTGVAGARPGTPNSAGKTKAPLSSGEAGGGGMGGGEGGGGDQFHIHGDLNVHSNSFEDMVNQVVAKSQQSQLSGAQAAYPTKTP